MRKVVWAVRAAAVLVLLAASGCYTVLSHPAQTDVVAAGSYYRSCNDCHADATYYHPYYHYGRSHDRWGDYYGYPWWYSDRWWWQPDNGSGQPPVPVETGTPHIWGGGGGGTKGWSFVLPATPPAQEQRNEGEGTGQTDDGKKDEKETDERHLWDSKKKGF
jgi:hypothetical protein